MPKDITEFNIGDKVKIEQKRNTFGKGKRYIEGQLDSLNARYFILKCKNYKECFLMAEIKSGNLKVI